MRDVYVVGACTTAFKKLLVETCKGVGLKRTRPEQTWISSRRTPG